MREPEYAEYDDLPAKRARRDVTDGYPLPSPWDYEEIPRNISRAESGALWRTV